MFMCQVKSVMNSTREGECTACLVCPTCQADHPLIAKRRKTPHGEEQLFGLLECNGFTVMREVKALLGKYGAVDFVVVLPSGKLLGIMHDGAQHFTSQSSKGMHQTSSMQQAARDVAFNAEVIRQGGAVIHGVLRLHYKDMGHWLQHITRAVRLTQRSHVKCFVAFSKSYGRKCMLG